MQLANSSPATPEAPEPIVTTAAYVSKGSLGWALAYPIALPLTMFLIALFVMPETRRMKVWAAEEEDRSAGLG